MSKAEHAVMMKRRGKGAFWPYWAKESLPPPTPKNFLRP